MHGPANEREITARLPAAEVGDRFTIDEIPHLPPVELVRKLQTTWVVAEIRQDGSRDPWSYRLSKACLIGKTIKILPHNSPPGTALTFPPVPSSKERPR